MTEEILVALVVRARNEPGEKSTAEAVSALGEYLYTHLHQFKLDYLTEDVRSDFIVSLYPRFERIVLQYNPERAAFRTYLHWIVSLSYRTFVRNHYGQEARQRVFEIEEMTRLLSEEAEQACQPVPETCLAEPRSSYRTDRPDSMRAPLSPKQNEIRSRQIFLLACKAGHLLDDASIRQVSEFTGYGEAYIREKVECIRSHGFRRTERARTLRERQNAYYIRAQRCRYEMNVVNRDTARYESLEKEYRFCLKRIAEIRNRAVRQIRSPSNRFLAVTLGICRGTIDSTLATAMHRGYSGAS
jgi:hypothetical protein